MAKTTKRTGSKRHNADPVVTEIVRNGVIAVTEEMKTNLMRTAYNIIIYEALDFTTGLFTPQGETISIGIGLPMFIRGMAETVKAKIKHFGATGHSSRRHLCHQRLLSHRQPSQSRHADPADLPPGQAGGVLLLHGALARHRRHSRRHEHRYLLGGTADPDPQISGPRRGQSDRGRHHPAERAPAEPGHGRSARAGHRGEDRRAAFPAAHRTLRPRCVLGSIAAIMDHAEAMARARTRTIPDGVYEAESYMDDDGIDIGKPVPIRVRVMVKGDEMTVDLSEVSKQVRGFYNSGITTGHACAQVAYKCLTSPTDYPINDGSFRSLKTIVPPGRVISAVRPAPMRWWMTYPMTIVDTIFKALAPAIPGRVIAGHHADLLASSFHGINEQDGRVLHRQLRSARRRLGRQDERGRRVRHRLHQRRRYPQQPERAGRVQVSDRSGAVCARARFRRRRPPPRRARGRAGGARAYQYDGQQSERPRPLPALGPRRRSRRRRQCGGAAHRRTMEERFSQCQGIGGAAQARRRLQDPFRRRRRLRQSAATADRAGAARTCGRAMSRSSPQPNSTASCSIPKLSKWIWPRPRSCAPPARRSPPMAPSRLNRRSRLNRLSER